MAMTADMHGIASVDAKSAIIEKTNKVVFWIKIKDPNGNEVTIFTKPHVARAMADAFASAMQKEAAE